MPILYEDYALSPAKTKDTEVTLTITLIGAPPPKPPTEIPIWLLVLIPGAVAAVFFAMLTPKEGA